MDRLDYTLKELGARRAPDQADVRAFARQGIREGGRRAVPVEARSFQERAKAEIRRYPEPETLPRWVLALVEKKVSVEEFAQTVRDRVLRAPSEENQGLALALANEIARQPDGSKILERHLTPELLKRVSGRAEQP